MEQPLCPLIVILQPPLPGFGKCNYCPGHLSVINCLAATRVLQTSHSRACPAKWLVAAEGRRLGREVRGWQDPDSLVQASKLAVFSQPPPMTATRETARLRLKPPSGAHHQLGCTEHPEPPAGSRGRPAPGGTIHVTVCGSRGMRLAENNMSNAPWRCAVEA